MAVLTALRGADLLRVKGLVAVEGCRGPVVVHAVQHVAHRPVELEDWPGGDRRSRLVFITRNLPRRVEALFAAVGGRGGGGEEEGLEAPRYSPVGRRADVPVRSYRASATTP